MMGERHMQTKILGDKTHRIYDDLTKKVSALITSIVTEINNKEAEETFNNILVILEDVNKNVAKEYSELKRNSEWDKFTIAFYGETNAGKSTIIETLRILWKDKQKVACIQKFKDIQKKYNLTQESFDSISKQIDFLEAEIEKKFIEISKIDFDTERLICEKKEVIKEFQANIPTKISSKKQWNKIKKNTKLDSALIIENTELRCIRSKRNILKQNNLINYALLKKELEDKKIIQEFLLEQKEFLKGLEDGAIIGDGRSDFTKTNTIYSFNLNNTIVDVIDVPGIEGSEGTVADEILKAVQKAHCVFYVTRKVTAPQTGDKKEGTLQKIKRHLGAQTEVWTIFNQSIKSTRRLNKSLVSEGELNSLKDLNQVMTNELGKDNYCGEFILSAHIAFLAISDCLIPGSRPMIEKSNFTSNFSTDLMFELSGFKDFVNKLSNGIITNKKEKIYKANYNKAMTVLDGVISKFDNIIENQIEPLRKEMNITYEVAMNSLVLEEKSVKLSLDKYHRNWLRKLISGCKKDLHHKIDEGVENEEVEELCQKVVSKHISSMKKVYEKDLKNEMGMFEKKIKNIVNDTFKYYDKTIKYQNKFNFDKQLEFEFEFKSGFNFTELLKGIFMGVIQMITGNPWFIASGIVTIVVGIYNSVKEFFSDSFKKNQQKEAVDKFLNSFKKEMKNELDKQNTKLKNQIEVGCGAVRDMLQDPLNKVIENKKCLEKTSKEIKKIKQRW